MGTECMTTHLKDESDGMPSVPPGFASLTSFTLQRVQDDVKIPVCSSNPIKTNADSDCSITGNDKFRKSLRHRPWVNYSKFDNSSEEEESDSELFEQNVPSIRCLPKGVLRGCAECRNCQKVIARWNADGACRPVLDEAPIFYPNEEEFRDTIKYIESIRPSAEPYGICRIVPPPSWKPPCLLKEESIWKNSKFDTRVQQIDKLQNRESLKKISRNQSIMRRKRRKLLKMGGSEMFDADQVGQHQNADRFGFEPGPEFTPESFQKYADDFKEQYFRADMNMSSDVRSRLHELSLDDIEGEYWRIVEKPTDEIEVLYGADLDTGAFGSGFSKASSSTTSEPDDHYVRSGWNLNHFPRLPGSVLCFESGDISGVLVPWLYIGMCFSSFCWHVEDHHLYSLNYLHLGAPKMWYGVPGKDALKLEAAMKKHLPDLFEEQPDLLHNLVTQFSPSLLKREGVPVYRCVQHEGEFVLTFPRAYHSGFNCGFNCAEAVNVAPVDWLPHGQTAVELYREQSRKITISHDKLLLGAAMEAVRAQWNILFLRKNTADNLRWKNVCGLDGILTRAVKARIELEHARRENLCCSSQSRKMDDDFDASDRECVVCHYDLHLAAVSCPCYSDRFACLIHAKQLCSCAWSTRSFWFRYEISELNVLVDALGGKLSAVHRWGISYLGLNLSSYVNKDKAQESKPVIKITKEGKKQDDKGQINPGSLNDTAKGYGSPQESKASVLQSSFPEVRKVREKVTPVAASHKNVHCPSIQRTESTSLSVSKEPIIRGVFLPQIVEESSTQSVEGCRSLGSSSSYSSANLPSSEGTTSTSSSSSEATNDRHFSKSSLKVMKPDKILLSGTRDVIPSNDGNHKGPDKTLFDKSNQEPLRESSKSSERWTDCDVKVTFSNSHKDTILLTPETNTSTMNEKDSNMLEKSCNLSDLPFVDDRHQGGGTCLKNFSGPLNQQVVRLSPQDISLCTNSSGASISKPIAKFLGVKEACDSSRADISGHLQAHRDSGTPNEESMRGKTELFSDHDMVDRGNLVATSPPSCSENSLDRCNRLQKGPRMAKVVRRINSTVEPLEYGIVLSGKLWSTSQAIFPKGYRSRVRYWSILDPMEMCYYISEILDAGLLGPLFMVTLEQRPSEVFIHVSATRCWDMVRERVNQEIRRQHSMGRMNLPTLQPPGCLDGLEMFGLSSPAIIQAIEALDRDHICTEYWRSRPLPQAMPSMAASNKDQGPSYVKERGNQDWFLPPGSSTALRGLLKKANPEELLALRNILHNDASNTSRQEVIMLINEQIENRHC
ncbi:lysine-specific demethylase JMJ703 [Typha latifolia]|uniref:lysine-specific demethylase JMJ703 n=1 Tax=Typha latifolia TaxID=4733 RepID=UPI003C301DA1